MEMPSQGYSQAGCRESSAKLAPREIAPHRKGVLPISIQSVYSFQIIVSRSSTDKNKDFLIRDRLAAPHNGV
jgi:hypothetical protein